MSEDFNFMTSSEKQKEATKRLRNSKPRLRDKMIRIEEGEEIATSGSPNAITPEIRAAAKKLAESSTGLDIAAFQRKYHIYVMNVDELLKG